MYKLLGSKVVLLVLLVLLTALSACDGGENIRQTLGLSRQAPDEFKVVSRPPLSLPPDYKLRPPRNGEPAMGSVPADQLAREAVTGVKSTAGLTKGYSITSVKPVSSHALGSNAEAGFLEKIGASQADPNIREQLYEDHQKVKKEASDSWFGPILPGGDDELVDAKAEAERIRDKQQAGEKVTGDDTRTRKDKAKSVIDQLF